MDETFRIDLPVTEVLLKSEGAGGRRCVKGFGSTGSRDHDGEEVVQQGMDFTPLQREGFINYDHQCREIAGAKMPVIIGYPTRVEMLAKGLWIEGELLQGDPMGSEQIRLANEMWELGCALQKSGGQRSLSYSIEGVIPKIGGRRGQKVVKSIARHVALTHKPVNADCSVEVFAKSLCCGRCDPGHPRYNPACACTNKADHGYQLEDLGPALEKALSTTVGAALMVENLDRGLTSVLYGDTGCGCFDPETGRFAQGMQGAVSHMTGCQGYNSDQTVRFLRRLLHAAPYEAWTGALVKRAGLVQP